MSTSFSSISSIAESINGSSASSSGSSSKGAASAVEQNDRFMKLLITQLTHQDPLNPMDNAQMTSQLAQISTVSGLEQVNSAVKSLGTQFVQMQALQGAALIGRDVVLPGNALAIADGVARGGFDIGASADRVRVEVLNSSGQIVKSIDLGAQGAGSNAFQFPASGLEVSAGYRFQVSAQSGNTALTAQPLMRDRVNAISTAGGGLTLELQRSGAVAYSEVRSVN